MRQSLLGFSLLFCAFFFVLGSADLGAQAKPAASQVKNPAQMNAGLPEIKDDYVVGVEDVLSIYVWKEPDFSVKELVVRSDGKISLPLVSDIQAGGFTPKQLQQAITERLKEFVATPNVTVTVIKSLSQSVSVVGQVNKPGTYPMLAPISVLELLARAGGLTELAKPKSIRIIRKENGKSLQFAFNYKEAIRGVNLYQNIMLKIGDVVLVP
jgi:polysaccharide biosynthesis/export protein